MERRIIHFVGHVQGVGFRYTAQSIAREHNVTGYVRNLEDGRVEMAVEGEREEIDRLIASISEHMRQYVQRIDQQTEAPTGEFKGFKIQH